MKIWNKNKWESKMLENVKKEVNFNKDEKEKEYIDVEVINIDGSTTKEHVKCERKKSKEFLDKREEFCDLYYYGQIKLKK